MCLIFIRPQKFLLVYNGKIVVVCVVVVCVVVVCVVVVCAVRRYIRCPDNNFSSSEWISMKFNKKVQYNKRKVGINFGDDGPNRFGIRGPKQAFSTFRISTCV